MSEVFERDRRTFSAADLESFEALCFHRSDEVVAPYAMFRRAPRMNDNDLAQKLVKRASENSAEAIRRASASNTGSGAEIFAYALASLCEGPGCIPGLITVYGPDDNFEVFECNIMKERGGPVNSSFSAPYGCGLIWNSFHFFDDPFGKGSAVGFSNYHLMDAGIEFAEWLFPERIAAMRQQA